MHRSPISDASGQEKYVHKVVSTVVHDSLYCYYPTEFMFGSPHTELLTCCASCENGAAHNRVVMLLRLAIAYATLERWSQQCLMTSAGPV